MKQRSSFVDILRTLDDADLDPYQFRLLVHIWRVGVCYERVRTLADKCDMSVGKASETLKWLEANGYIEKAQKDGRIGYSICSHNEQVQQLSQEQEVPAVPTEEEEPVHYANKYNNTGVEDVHHTNKTFTTRTKRSPHEQNVHHMNAILSIPSEVDLISKPKKGERARAREEPAAPLPPERLALGEMANALEDVTGMSARMNWPALSAAAEDLLASGHTAAEVLYYFRREDNPNGHWNWYAQDWRGKRGDFPTPKQVKETIRGAITWKPPTAANGRHPPTRNLADDPAAIEAYTNSPEYRSTF